MAEPSAETMVNSEDVPSVDGNGRILPTCSTCKQVARSVDRYTGDRKQILKWTKCDVGQDRDLVCVTTPMI